MGYLDRMLMSKNVNNDVSQDSLIRALLHHAILFRQNLYKNVPGPTLVDMKVPSYAISLYQQTLHQVESSSTATVTIVAGNRYRTGSF